MDARHREVLIAVIREYIDSAEPVGSRVLTKRHFPNLSPATIRNTMSDLEDMGYLAQPHTSAGRVPTDKAYRFYVESFPPPQAGSPAGALSGAPRHRGIDCFMEQTSSHLSAVTRLTGLLLAPPLKHTTIARVDLVPLEDDRALAVVVTDAGWLTVREITLDRPLGRDEVRAIGRELTRRFRDRTVQADPRHGAGARRSARHAAHARRGRSSSRSSPCCAAARSTSAAPSTCSIIPSSGTSRPRASSCARSSTRNSWPSS